MLNHFLAAIGRNIRAVTTAVVYNNILAGVADGMTKAKETLTLTYEPEELYAEQPEEIDPEDLLLSVE